MFRYNWKMSRTSVTLLKAIPCFLLVALFPTVAGAQTEGRVGVGGSVTFVSPTDDDVASRFSVGPLVRLNPKKGFGFAGALNWFRADLQNPAGGDAPFARLRARPLAHRPR